MTKKQKKVLMRILLTSALVIILVLIPVHGYVRFGLFMIPYLLIGYDILKKAIIGIWNRQIFDENFLMAIATVGAIALGDYVEGVAVMLFYQIGEWFQSYAVRKSRRNISELMDIRPDYANMETEEGIRQVSPDEVAIGSIILVRPGEKIPIDGIIEEGKSSLDTTALTGESVPCEVKEGDTVMSGCINLSGLIRIRTQKEFGESTVSKILELVENSGSKKSRPENFISKFARYYTPVVCCSALALAIIPPFVRLFLGMEALWGTWIYRALTFLVISCPCALVISIPLSFFAGIGAAGKAGILVKGSNYLEALAKTKSFVFDKTGTLTQGVFEVVEIFHNQIEESQLLEYAALAESYSLHPISNSLSVAYGKEQDLSRVSDVEEMSGHGVIAVIDGKKVVVGNEKLMKKQKISVPICDKIGTIVHVAVDGIYAGGILIADKVKATSPKALKDLRKIGAKRIIMLTGDEKAVANKVADSLGITEVYSQLLPADKVKKVEEFLQQKEGNERVAFVGDGINDAPVLTRADIGIAMGALGSDAAIEAADIVLMDDNPQKIVTAIQIAKKCMNIVYQNICFALGIKLVCLLLGALGIANMWIAIFADVGVMVLAVLNAIRILFTRKR